MIKLKDLIIETWNSNIWPSDLWNSDIWNSDIWPSHVWEGKKLDEWIGEGVKNYWLSPDGKMIEVYDHIEYVVEFIDPDSFYMEDGYPMKDDGSIVEEDDVYEVAYAKQFVRVVIESNEKKMYFSYGEGFPPNRKQLSELKNFAIEHQYELINSMNNRPVDLS